MAGLGEGRNETVWKARRDLLGSGGISRRMNRAMSECLWLRSFWGIIALNAKKEKFFDLFSNNYNLDKIISSQGGVGNIRKHF